MAFGPGKTAVTQEKPRQGFPTRCRPLPRKSNSANHHGSDDAVKQKAFASSELLPKTCSVASAHSTQESLDISPPRYISPTSFSNSSSTANSLHPVASTQHTENASSPTFAPQTNVALYEQQLNASASALAAIHAGTPFSGQSEQWDTPWHQLTGAADHFIQAGVLKKEHLSQLPRLSSADIAAQQEAALGYQKKARQELLKCHRALQHHILRRQKQRLSDPSQWIQEENQLLQKRELEYQQSQQLCFRKMNEEQHVLQQLQHSHILSGLPQHQHVYQNAPGPALLPPSAFPQTQVQPGCPEQMVVSPPATPSATSVPGEPLRGTLTRHTASTKTAYLPPHNNPPNDAFPALHNSASRSLIPSGQMCGSFDQIGAQPRQPWPQNPTFNYPRPAQQQTDLRAYQQQIESNVMPLTTYSPNSYASTGPTAPFMSNSTSCWWPPYPALPVKQFSP